MEIGKLIQQTQGYKAFIPNDFPPKGIHFSPEIYLTNDKATHALGKLNMIAQMIPDVSFFLTTYIQKEAALSSNIEGTRATMNDALRVGANITENVPDDVENIIGYVKAVQVGLSSITSSPLTLRVVRDIHSALMAGTQEGIGKTPGEFRRTQNWIGGTRPDNADFVPPPPYELSRALSDIEKFINRPQQYPPLIKAALLHAQFETVHPFLDGNGRTGRLLVALQLKQDGMLDYPVLYLSEYFKRHRDTYFDRLSAYHNRGEIERWILFFLEGIITIAGDAVEVSKKIMALRDKHQTLAHSLGVKQAKSALKLLEGLYEKPFIDISAAEKITGLSRPAANALVKKFVEIEILRPVDKTNTYGRQFVYLEYLILFNEKEIDEQMQNLKNEDSKNKKTT